MLLDPKDHKTLLDLLNRWGGKFAVAESLTVGNIQRALGEMSGVSAHMEGGITAYSIEQKVKLLGVNRDEAEEMNAVSPAIARQMAAGAMRLFNTQMAMATTGYAEPDPVRKVERPMGYWCCIVLVDGAPQVMDGLWEGKKGMGRVEAQKDLAKTVVRESFAFLARVLKG